MVDPDLEPLQRPNGGGEQEPRLPSTPVSRLTEGVRGMSLGGDEEEEPSESAADIIARLRDEIEPLKVQLDDLRAALRDLQGPEDLQDRRKISDQQHDVTTQIRLRAQAIKRLERGESIADIAPLLRGTPSTPVRPAARTPTATRTPSTRIERLRVEFQREYERARAANILDTIAAWLPQITEIPEGDDEQEIAFYEAILPFMRAANRNPRNAERELLIALNEAEQRVLAAEKLTREFARLEPDLANINLRTATVERLSARLDAMRDLIDDGGATADDDLTPPPTPGTDGESSAERRRRDAEEERARRETERAERQAARQRERDEARRAASERQRAAEEAERDRIVRDRVAREEEARTARERKEAERLAAKQRREAEREAAKARVDAEKRARELAAEEAKRAQEREAVRKQSEDVEDEREDNAARRRNRRLRRAEEDVLDNPEDAAGILGEAAGAIDAAEDADDVVENADEEAGEEALDAIDAGVGIDIELDPNATFPSLNNAATRLSASALVTTRLLGAGAANFVEWEPLDENDTPKRNTLRVYGNREAVYYVYERLVGPLFEAWAVEGLASNSNFGRTAASLHTAYWTDTVVPLLTQIAIAFHEKWQADQLAEQSDVNDAHSANQQLDLAFREMRDLARFIVTKALTGMEAGNLEGSEQKEAVRARSILDESGVVASDRDLAQTVGEPYQQTRNQLLRYDRPFVKKNKRLDSWARTEADQAARTAGAISTPIIKMIFTREYAQNQVPVSNEAGKRLFTIAIGASGAENGVPRLGNVDFASLAADTVPKRGAKNVIVATDRSAQSHDSFIARAFALPLLDALFLSEYMKLPGKVYPDQYSFQNVGDGLSKVYYTALPLLPLFFEQGTETALSEEDNATDAVLIVEREYENAVAKTKVVRYKFRVTPVRRGTSIDTLRGREEDVVALYAEARAEFDVEVDPDTFEQLLFVAAVHQIANLDNVFDVGTGNTSMATIAERLAAAHKIVAYVFFKPVTLGDSDPSPQTSLFQRYGKRPMFVRDVRDGVADKRFFRSAAKQCSGEHAEHVRRKILFTPGGPPIVATVSAPGPEDDDFVGAEDDGELRLDQHTLDSAALPRPLRKIMSQAILAYKGPGASQIIQYKRWLAGRLLDGKLAEEVDNPNEKLRTVLVPTDDALDAYASSTAFRNRLLMHQQKTQAEVTQDDVDALVHETLLYHVISGEYDLKNLRNEPKPAALQTELFLDAEKKNGAVLKLRVVSYSTSLLKRSAAYSGSVAINEGSAGRSGVFSVSEANYAKNGIFYIIDGVADPVAALGTARNRLFVPQARLPPPLVGDGLQRQQEDEEEEEEEYVSLPLPSTGRWTVSDLERLDRELRELRNVRDRLLERTRGRPVSREMQAQLAAAERNLRRAELEYQEAQRHVAAERVRLTKSEATAVDSGCAAHRQQARSYAKRLRSRESAQAMQELYASSANVCADLLGKSREQVKRQNAKDFEPWSAFLQRTGVLAQVESAARQGIPVHIMTPTPQALKAAKLDLAHASASLGQAHVAFGSVPAPDGTSVTTPITSFELHQLMQRDESTTLETLDKSAKIEHMSISKHGRSPAPGLAPGASALYLDDLQFRDPAHTHHVDGATTPVHVHFINRVLHHAAHQAERKESTQTAASGTKETTAPLAAPAAPAQVQNSKGDAKETVVSADHGGGPHVAEAWRSTVQRVAKDLATSTDSANYARRISELDVYLNGLGGTMTVGRLFTREELARQFKSLKTAIAQNQFIDTVRKGETHDALNKLRSRFPLA